jgi:GntR family transcriptional regulator
MAPPMYHKIADELRAQIESGELAPGAQLPTELELRDQYEASRNTIRDAIKRLTSLGLVETRPGQGTFVVQKIDPFVTTLTGSWVGGEGGDSSAAYLSEVGHEGREAEVSRPRVEILPAPEQVALRLRFELGAQVVSRHQERFIGGLPWSLQTSFYPMEFVTERGATELLKAEDMPDGVVRYLEQTLNIKQVGYRDWVTARNPDPNEQNFFRIPHDSTVFEIFRTSFDGSGSPIRVTLTVYPADRNQFIVNVGETPEPRYVPPPTQQLCCASAPQAADPSSLQNICAHIPGQCRSGASKDNTLEHRTSGVAVIPASHSSSSFTSARPRVLPGHGLQHSPATTQFRDSPVLKRDPITTMQLIRAEEEHLPIILDLINDAVDKRLRYLGTDQWEKPWPTREERDDRVLRGLGGRKTWIVWDGDTAAATVTVAKQANVEVWPAELNRDETAVYVHRLITRTAYQGRGLGASLVDWAGREAAEQYGAKWIRIDVWRENKALHAYYRGIGFVFVGFSDDPDYPSGALFQKPVPTQEPTVPLLWDVTEDTSLC